MPKKMNRLRSISDGKLKDDEKIMQKILLFGNVGYENGEVCGAAAYVAAGLVKLGFCASVFARIEKADEENIRAFFLKNGIDEGNLFTDEYKLCDEGISAVFVTGDFVADSFGMTLIMENSDKYRGLEIPIIFDPGISRKNIGEIADSLNEIARISTVFVPSSEDAIELCGMTDAEKIAEYYLKLGAHKVVVTLDKQGAFYKSRVECGCAPAFRADKVVDTTGAGGAFAAGLISGIAEELPLGEAVVRANACGCMAIQHEGFYMPDNALLREYMLTHRFVVEGCKDY